MARGRTPPRRRRHAVPAAGRYESDAETDPQTRQEISRVIGSARRGLQGLRLLFIGDAGLLGLMFLLSLGTDSDVFKVVTGALCVAAVLGAIFVVRYPLVWATALALFHSGLAVLVTVGRIGGLQRWIAVTICFLLWGAVGMAKNMRDLLRRYPDVWAAKRMLGQGRAPDGMGSKWRDLSAREKAASRKRLLLFVVLPVVLAIAALILFAGSENERPGTPQAPPTPQAPLQPRLDALQKAWNEQSLREIRALFAEDVAPHKARLLAKLFRRREWMSKRPPITFQHRDSVVPHQVAIFWSIEGETKLMQTDWQWEHGAWWMLDLKLRLAD